MVNSSYQVKKRIFDIILAASGIFIFLPLMLVISYLILLDDGWPVFYIKKSLGKSGEPFDLLKFRSMNKNSKEITRIGGILRRTALDELPQLINILKGQMSFVGPRPYNVNKYIIMGLHKGGSLDINYPDDGKEAENKLFFYRLSIIPGLTGLAQLYVSKNGTNMDVGYWDNIYINKRDFFFDLKIVFLSVMISLKGRWEMATNKF